MHSGSEGSSEANCYTAKTVFRSHSVRVISRAVTSCHATRRELMLWSGVSNMARDLYVTNCRPRALDMSHVTVA